MSNILTTCLLLLFSAHLVCSSGVFELKVHAFRSTRAFCPHANECRIFFRVCLNHSQDVILPESPCTYGTGLTEPFNSDQSSIFGSAPISVPFSFKWPRTFLLIIEVWSADSSPEQSTENQTNLITRLATEHTLATEKDLAQHVHQGEQSELRYSYHVIYCRPRDDTFGHYTCDSKGSRICLEGWKGEYCTEPICLSDCSEEHGYCETPGECKCRYGWQGPLCDECQPYPACVHGTCSQPWQCNCKEGWGGLLCDKDLRRRDI